MILSEALANELAALHLKVNRACSTLDDLWQYHCGGSMRSTLQRDRMAAKEFPALKEMQIYRLQRLASQLEDALAECSAVEGRPKG